MIAIGARRYVYAFVTLSLCSFFALSSISLTLTAYCIFTVTVFTVLVSIIVPITGYYLLFAQRGATLATAIGNKILIIYNHRSVSFHLLLIDRLRCLS